MSANLDIMAGDLSKLNEFFYEDPLILLTTRERERACFQKELWVAHHKSYM